jgi:SAM-dependent methyltransferase
MTERPPTAHERMAGQPWDASYQDGPAPWDIGGPQPAVVRLADAGVFTSPVLDVGCGTGDNGLYIASQGLSVVGVDVAETAVAMARAATAARGLDAEFFVGDAFELSALGRTFASVLDCALFHALDSEERLRYTASLAAVTSPGAVAYVLCFSDEGEDLGPHPVPQGELRAAFADSRGWRIIDISEERLETRFHENGAPAWLTKVERI